jgi:signal peptidase
MRKKSPQAIIKTFLYLITLLFGIFVISVSTRVGRYNESLLNYNFFIVLSDSMRPAFKANDLIVTQKKNAESIVVGDIITYYSRDNASFGEIITHSVVEISNINGDLQFQTKGLNNDSLDPYLVNSEDIIGVYIFNIPDLANFLYFTRTTMGYLTIVVVPFSFLVTIEVFEIRKKLKFERLKELSEIYKLLNLEPKSLEAKNLSKTNITIEDVKRLIEINKK